jgi:hypothetical protein
MSSRLTVVLSMSLLVVGWVPDSASAETLSNGAIVDGHHVQPRANQFGGIRSPSDLPRREDREVTSLYQQLLSAPAATAPRATHSGKGDD